MLEFFRRFQKGFFLVVTVVLIISFFFFGIFSTLAPSSEQEDHSIGNAIDGSEISFLEMNRLVRFLSSDAQTAEAGSSLNFFNDGVLQKDFLETGLGGVLAASYFDDVKEDIQTRLAQARRYRPYAHPDAPFLSVQAIWDQFSPELSKTLVSLRGQLEASTDTFAYLTKLYLDQKKLSPELVRRILMYQMGQYSSIRPDPSIQHQDFALFGYHSFRDWFGEKWIEKAAWFIWNAALVAQEKGFAVSKDEAKADLWFRLEEASQKRPQINLSWEGELQKLGMSEKEALDVWQKVMLFRRYMNSVSEAVLLDHVLSKDLSDYAQQTVLVDVYSFPDSLTLKTADDFFALQYYLDAVAVPEKDRLSLPAAYKPIEEVLKKAPQFVETLFTAEVSKISRGELGLRVSLKDVLQWQFAHWDLLCSQFSILPKSAQSRSEQAAALEKLEPAVRLQADEWVRLQIVEDHPEWIEEAFQAAQPAKQTFSFSAGRVNAHYVQDAAEFETMFELALLGEEKALQYLSSYSDGRLSLYRITHVEKTAAPQIRTLASMKQDGTLKKMLDRYLDQQYPKIREKSPEGYKTKTGEWKPFAEVKEQVGWAVYAEICRAIDAKEKLVKASSEQHIRSRLAYPMKLALKALRDDRSEFQVVSQFQLVQQEKKFERTGVFDEALREAFALEPRQWSSVHASGNGRLSFFYVKEKNLPSNPSLEPMAASKAMLAGEAMHMLAKKIIHRMQEN